MTPHYEKLREEFWEAPELQYIFTHPERIEKPEIQVIADWWLSKHKEHIKKVVEEVLKINNTPLHEYKEEQHHVNDLIREHFSSLGITENT